MRDMIQTMGKAVVLFHPDSIASDQTSIGDARIKVESYGGMLFAIQVGDITTTGTLSVSIVKASTNTETASDYAEIAGATDAVIEADSDSGANTLRLINVRLHDKSVAFTDFIAARVVTTGAPIELGVLAIPYGGNLVLPVSQTTTPIST